MTTPSTTWALRRERLPRGRDIVDRDRDLGPHGAVLAVLLPGLVAVELVGAQADAGGDRGRLASPAIARHRAVRRSRSPRRWPALSLPAATPPNLRKSFSLRSAGLPAPITIRRSASIPSGARISSVEPLLPLNWLAAAARLIGLGCRAQRLPGRRAELQLPRRRTPPECRGAAAENADKADLDGVGHRINPPELRAVARTGGGPSGARNESSVTVRIAPDRVSTHYGLSATRAAKRRSGRKATCKRIY